jgi:hypothetical protein
MILKINQYLHRTSDAASLAVFRVFFGLMMLFGMVRFWSKGWIYSTYVEPKFHFKYFGFEWIKSPGEYTYILFIICIVCALCVTLGFKYKFNMALFFLSFTYIELIDKTTYLNHYYFISILSFILIFIPANAKFSLDNYIEKKQYDEVPTWTIDSLKLLLIIVYFCAGLAKINSDWLLKAMPLKIWLPSKYDLPIIGETILQYNWVHYVMSWGGMLYDLLIPFLLLYKKTRLFGFLLVIFFHLFTAVLFPIGMFPYVMIVSTIIFFEAQTHKKIIKLLKRVVYPLAKNSTYNNTTVSNFKYKNKYLILGIFMVFFIIQLILPFRYMLYPSELFWTEEGYRFSWRVMLVEKIGYTNFKVKNLKSGKSFYVRNGHFLTDLQIKQMSFQPDMILEYAHYLGDHFESQGHKDIAIFAESYVALNGRSSQEFINSKIDLLSTEESFKHKYWIKPFKDEIKGF